ncbi:hypothetical protein PR202_gb29313 [Eleusine coracana subsp. coracana]|uniref:Uncharacterized protein n=1 Tax=Eleusine coracana subsp. coracana TaxID=191504 RepID=A0AAV5FWS4_ELECO|nr:hypothetical protein PR202_gb29313 [Eleusine coracana subsp. coracana]
MVIQVPLYVATKMSPVKGESPFIPSPEQYASAAARNIGYEASDLLRVASPRIRCHLEPRPKRESSQVPPHTMGGGERREIEGTPPYTALKGEGEGRLVEKKEKCGAAPHACAKRKETVATTYMSAIITEVRKWQWRLTDVSKHRH